MPSRPLRILLLNSARKWIGEAAHALALAEELRRAGHHVVLGVRAGSELEQRARAAGLEPVVFHFNSRFYPARDLSDWRKIRAIVRREAIEIVHCHRGKDHWLAAAALLGLRMALPEGPARPVPLVRTRHVVTPARQHLLNRWLYRRATRGLISVSAQARASLGPLAQGFAEGCEKIIYSPVNAGVFSADKRSEEVRNTLGAEAETVLMGLIGRIQRVKGQRHFLRAAALVAAQYPQARFLIAGRGSPRQVQALWEFAESVGLARERLRILGMLDDLPAIMASLDIGVVASVGSEGSSRVTLEYMASGLPVVATRVGGIPEILTDGVEGFLVPPRDSEAMAEKLAILAGDCALRQRLGAAGRMAAIRRHGAALWITEVEKLYRRLDTSHWGENTK